MIGTLTKCANKKKYRQNKKTPPLRRRQLAIESDDDDDDDDDNDSDNDNQNNLNNCPYRQANTPMPVQQPV